MTSQNGQTGSPSKPGKSAMRRRFEVIRRCGAVRIEGRGDAVQNRRTVLNLIATSANMSDPQQYGRCWWSSEEFAGDDMSVRTVRRALAALREQGLIRIDIVRRRDSFKVTRYIILDAKLLPDWQVADSYPRESVRKKLSVRKKRTVSLGKCPQVADSYPRESVRIRRRRRVEERATRTDTHAHGPARTHAHEGDGPSGGGDGQNVPVPTHESQEVPVPVDESQKEAALIDGLADQLSVSPRRRPRHTRQSGNYAQPAAAPRRPRQQRPRQPATAPRYTDRLTDTYCYRKPQSAEDREANRAYMAKMGFGAGAANGTSEEATRKKAGRIADETKRADAVTRQPGSRAAQLRAGVEAKLNATASEGHVTVTAEEVESKLAALATLSNKSTDQ